VWPSRVNASEIALPINPLEPEMRIRMALIHPSFEMKTHLQDGAVARSDSIYEMTLRPLAVRRQEIGSGDRGGR
jgi:hypothetical protein